MATKTYPHMTREQWLQWADALESGPYEQITGSLTEWLDWSDDERKRDWTRTCCLGACVKEMHGGEFTYPESIGLMTGDQQDLFVSLNDRRFYSFAQIASAIRDNIDTLVAGGVPEVAQAVTS